MEIGKFSIHGDRCYGDTCGFIEDNFEIEYAKDLPGGKIFFSENYSWMANNQLMIAITIQKIDSSENYCELTIVAGGGGSGLFNVRWGNESRRLGKFFSMLNRFCTTSGFDLTQQ